MDCIEHAYSVSEPILAMIKEKGVPLVPTDYDSAKLLRSNPAWTPAQIPQITAARRERLRLAMALGITIVAGSDMYRSDLGMSQGEGAKHVLFSYSDVNDHVIFPPVIS